MENCIEKRNIHSNFPILKSPQNKIFMFQKHQLVNKNINKIYLSNDLSL